VAQVGALHGWLTSHVKAMDQAFALWCARNGLRPDAPEP
jgi:hemerythrin